jgi:3-hydroxybutyryl-CoA dehydrogenase
LGKQISEWSAMHGYNVNIYDVNPRGLVEFVDEVSCKIRSKKSTGEIHLFNSLSKTVEKADLIIEAVPENLELKRNIFSEIDRNAPPHAILATNSSSIPVSRLEESVERKNKLLNIHFYQLPHYPMADIARGPQTDDETFTKGKKWLESIDITPLILKKECLGFVYNRVWRAIKKECLKIWAGGYADIEDVDKAWKIVTNMNVGPFGLMDVVGLDVVYDIEMMYYKESGDPKDKPPHELKDKIDKNELGQKTGKGFYNWKDDKVIH